MRNRSPDVNPERGNPFSRPHVFRDLLIVGSPILLMAAAGSIGGLDTLEGGAVVNLVMRWR